jgi:predicted transcriptional regulator YdeE
MDPKLTTIKQMNIVGLEVRTTNQEEMNPGTGRISGIWESFYQERLMETIQGRKSDCVPLGVYSKYETDHTGPYSLLAGVEVSGLDIGDGMTGVSILGGQYLVFAVHGPMPQSLIQAWVAIWDYFSENLKYKRAYTTDFELYRGMDMVDIYIAVK